MDLSKETLSAFVDGELEPAETARIATLVERDPSLKSYVDEQERLRTNLRAAFAGVMDEPVPDRLLMAVANSPVSFRVRMKEWLAPGDARGASISRFAIPAMAMAAGLLIGIGLEQTPATDIQVSPSNGQMVASAGLADALEHKLASEEGAARIGVSFRSKSGAPCRTFEIADGNNVSDGLACRNNGTWQVGTVTSGSKTGSGGSYQLAGSEMPDAIRAAVASSIQGEPFDAAAERRARDNGWK